MDADTFLEDEELAGGSRLRPWKGQELDARALVMGAAQHFFFDAENAAIPKAKALAAQVANRILLAGGRPENALYVTEKTYGDIFSRLIDTWYADKDDPRFASVREYMPYMRTGRRLFLRKVKPTSQPKAAVAAQGVKRLRSSADEADVSPPPAQIKRAAAAAPPSEEMPTYDEFLQRQKERLAACVAALRAPVRKEIDKSIYDLNEKAIIALPSMQDQPVPVKEEFFAEMRRKFPKQIWYEGVGERGAPVMMPAPADPNAPMPESAKYELRL